MMRKKAGTGMLHWIFPAMIFLAALEMFLSGRDLSQQYLQLLQTGESTRHPLMTIAQRSVSVLLLVASVEQIANHFALRRPTPSATLLIAFVLYWVCTVASPALFGANPLIGHEYMYSLFVGVAACLVGPAEWQRILRSARDALFLLMLAGVLVAPFKPGLVMDVYYSQGLIPGLPRFGGLTAHPVTQGMLAQVALLVLWCMPYQRRWLQRAAWVLGLAVLYLAQSKTAWASFIACALLLLAVRGGPRLWRRMSDPRQGGFGVLVLLGLVVGVAGLATWVLVGDAFGRASELADTREAAQLMSLTGRDRIWVIAVEEWQRNPVFGYGLTLFDSAYRAAINLPHATHAHNQFLDDLARSGAIGASALVIYAAVLFGLALRGARASGGLSLALFLAVALRSVSEVPLSLKGYGTELVTHLLLITTLAAASAQRRTEPRPQAMRYGVA
ncbi:O-antigen ligase family protein [Ramlibacter sp. AW1]|uniref:O-antigen ligase family protein n=1 Tax=Ramlibacter aurantiacus TaxID=2801330 RepID=A0A937D6J4_9BURK|nr:O-antigen ligase family protein [Ramlibacter aurantiacus]MBL0421013.1 O-antigen ligase family protein [Ramlibacter aurantiacus]